MKTQEVAEKYVALCKAGKFLDVLDALYAKDAVSVEPAAPTDAARTVIGLEAIRAKGKEWDDSHIVHKGEVSGPYPHGDRFAVRFMFDITDKPSGKRATMDEVGLFTVKDGKITREEFFYPTG